MSLEQLVIALFVVIPLFEGLMRVLRARAPRREGRPDKVLAQSSTPRPTSQLPAREVAMNGRKVDDVAADTRMLPAAAPLLSPRRHTRERLMRRKRSRASEQTPGVPVFKVAPRAHDRAREARRQWIGPSRDLRSAIVLTTVLDPCRALAPRDMPYNPP